jgi:hypothetical protein
MTSAAQSELLPSIPARGELHRVAREVRALAQVAVECSTAGSGLDIVRAADKLRQAAALIGPLPGPSRL